MARSGIKHGTRPGYDKHYRTRKGSWKWPLDKDDKCGCLGAYQEYQREFKSRPEQVAASRQRSMARHRAYKRLSDMHPADYAKLYTEELSIIQDGGKVILGTLMSELKQATSAASEEDLGRLVRDGSATLRERDIYWRIQGLRIRVEEARARVAAREPDGDS
jgi:hypothetical protein